MVIGDKQRLSVRITARVQALVRERSTSARDVSVALGKSRSWLSDRYRGRATYTIDDIETLAEHFDVGLGELLGVPILSTGGEFVPVDVQELADELVRMVLPQYARQDLTDGERDALVRTAHEALTYVAKGVTYWSKAVASRRAPKGGDDRGGR